MILMFIVGYVAGVIVMTYIEWVTVHNTGKSIFQQPREQL